MKSARLLLTTAVASAALAAFGWFFLGQLGGGGARPEGPAGVLLSAPPEFVIEDLGTAERAEAAQTLAALLARRLGEPKLGIHFRSGSHELFWLVDRAAPAGPVLIERSAGPGGTRLETQWRGGLEARLAWARGHEGFDTPGLAAGERRNLYH